MSLIDLAEQNNLPDHQYMDEETLSWICGNPVVCDHKKIDYSPIEFQKFFPKKEWYPSLEVASSIHGVRHSARVAVFSEVLFKSRNWLFFYLNLKNVLTVAFLHDICRESDKNDIGHGRRSADWFSNNIIEVENTFHVRYNKKDVDSIINAIAYHDVDHNRIEKDISFGHRKIIDIIKTADALDRYRMPKIKWRIDCRRLNLIPSEKMKFFAYMMVCLTEKGYLGGIDCFSPELYSTSVDKIKKL